MVYFRVSPPPHQRFALGLRASLHRFALGLVQFGLLLVILIKRGVLLGLGPPTNGLGWFGLGCSSRRTRAIFHLFPFGTVKFLGGGG